MCTLLWEAIFFLLLKLSLAVCLSRGRSNVTLYILSAWHRVHLLKKVIGAQITSHLFCATCCWEHFRIWIHSFIVAIAAPHSCPSEFTGSCDSFPSQPLGTCNSSYLSGFSSTLGACCTRRMHNLQPTGEKEQWLNGTTSPAPSGMLLRHSTGSFSEGLRKFSPCLQPELAHCSRFVVSFPSLPWFPFSTLLTVLPGITSQVIYLHSSSCLRVYSWRYPSWTLLLL